MSPRKRRKPRKVGPSGGSLRNPKSLANLKRTAPLGNTRTVTHGFTSRLLVRDVSTEVAELAELLAEAAPVKDADGSAPLADTVAVEVAAAALKRWRSVHTWCELHGRITERGEVKPAAAYEVQGETALHRALDVLGMNPASRSRLGLNIARAQTFDLARHWQEQDDA